MIGLLARSLMAAALALAWSTMVPAAASAERPPAVDDTYLPPAATPNPPEATEKEADCNVVEFDPRLVAGNSQLSGIDLPALWALSTGAGQTVAVIDTGVSPHPQLPRLVGGGDYVFTGDGREDCDGHGTLVAGIIAATTDPDAKTRFAGIAPGVSLITIRQTSVYYGPVGAEKSGMGTVDTMAMAVRTAADLGATVINISSVACTSAAGLRDRALGAAVAYAVDVKDAVIVVSAGNVGPGGQCPQQNPTSSPRPNEPDWATAAVAVSPGWYDDYVLTVGSVGIDGAPSSFSLAGPWVDVAGPGEAVVSLDPRHSGVVNKNRNANGAAIMGTSYAAPVVSGLAALVRSRFPKLSARQVMQRIEATAHRSTGGWNPMVGNGIVDLQAALSEDPAVPRTPPPMPTKRPVAPPVPPAPTDSGGRSTAFTGVAGCAAVLAGALALLAPVNRLALRRGRDNPAPVAGDAVVSD